MANQSDQEAPGGMAKDLAEAYARMLDRIRRRLAEVEASAPLPIYMVIEEARVQAVELGEMTQAEAQEVAEWLGRDLLHLRDLLERAERGARNWLGMDLVMIERSLLDTLADPTRVDWLRLQEEFERQRESSGPGEKPQKRQPGNSQKP